MTLSEFLLARIDEDEELARNSLGAAWLRWMSAECEAKRRIVADYEMWSAESDSDAAIAWHALKPCIRALTLPYTDHADYNPAWRP